MSLSKAASSVLFNEDYLDMILPYLSTADLKSVRLVTPFWNKIGTKFLGRKSFKPIRFSGTHRINYENWMALKREIEATRPEENHRIKLFQGFYLTWADVIMMGYLYHNFMSTLKPSQIIIQGPNQNAPGFSDSLPSLFTPILDTLRDVTLKIKWSVLRQNFPLLGNFANLGGMHLKRLHLIIFNNKLDPCRGSASKLLQILSNLLTSQAPTLEELRLEIKCRVEKGAVEDSMIKLPIFPRLHTLLLLIKLSNPNILNIFQPFNFSEKFPKLECLKLYSNLLLEMFEPDNTFDLSEGHPLKKLDVNYLDFDYEICMLILNKLRISFPFVEEFAVQDLLTHGAEIPWVDTLKKLEISGASTFNLVHLKKIEAISLKVSGSLGLQELINRLLNHYQELPHLKKFHISGLKITAQQMTQIQEAIPPQFHGILTTSE